METLEILVNKAEIIAHSNPSGLDAKTCLSDKAITFIRNIGFSTLNLWTWMRVLLSQIQVFMEILVKQLKKLHKLRKLDLPHLAALERLDRDGSKSDSSQNYF